MTTVLPLNDSSAAERTTAETTSSTVQSGNPINAARVSGVTIPVSVNQGQMMLVLLHESRSVDEQRGIGRSAYLMPWSCPSK